MGGHWNDMDYGSKDGKNKSNITLLVEQLTAKNHKHDENICNNNNFEVEYILRPVAETTLKEFIDTCVRNVSNFPEDWSLCTDHGAFNCGPVTDYVSACAAETARKCDMDNSQSGEPCTMGTMISHSGGLLVLFSLVLIGMLIGISITVAICLICPRIHRWANTKIRGEHFVEKSRTQPSSVFHLRTVERQNTGGSSGPYETEFNHQYMDNHHPRTSNGDDDSTNEYTYIGAGGGVRISGNQSLQDYEGLRRNNSQQQSHKYAHLPQTVPDEGGSQTVPEGSLHGAVSIENSGPESTQESGPPNDYAHNYFVLEKNQS